MAKILDGLGPGYRRRAIDEAAILDPKAAGRYSAIFLPCGKVGGKPRVPGLERGLREYVAGGGTLYASDLRYDAVAAAFPELVDPAAVAQGVRQEVTASVVSPELRAEVGAEIPLHFELDGWRPAAFRGADVDVLIKGKVAHEQPVNIIEAPLLVKFTFGMGDRLLHLVPPRQEEQPG